MSELNSTINSIAEGLHKADIINKVTLRELIDEDFPELLEYTGEEIQILREREHISQSVFAKYLNISLSMVRSLENGKRRARGAILQLLNLIDRNGLSILQVNCNAQN